MKVISSREFQKAYAKLDEPYLVKSWGEDMGAWVPVTSPLFQTLGIVEPPSEEKAQPTQVVRKLPNNNKVVRTEVRIIDTVKIAEQAEISREMWRHKPANSRER